MDGVTKLLEFVELHKPQLEMSGVPQHLWEAVYRKVTREIFDAGQVFQLMLIDYEDLSSSSEDDNRPAYALVVLREQGISPTDPNAVFLSDHAWTFRSNEARIQLQQNETLVKRLCRIMGICESDTKPDSCIKQVLSRMWRYCQTYTVASAVQVDIEQRLPVWYIMDEVGCAINHSDQPNCRLVPFLDLNTGITYSLFFPVQEIAEGELITRDFVEFATAEEPIKRAALLLPWQEHDFSEVDFTQEEPGIDYFISGHVPETCPEVRTTSQPYEYTGPLRVYAEYDEVRNNLTASEFTLVDSAEQADVLWLCRHFRDFAQLAQDSPQKFINQFPYEYAITVKDLLAIIARRAASHHHVQQTLDTFPCWLPTTYNLSSELVQFVSYFQQRAAKQLDNHWIVKPWNLARALDQEITDNLTHIVRLPLTGPKIIQKYIHRPVLFHRADLNAQVKFDLRYVVLLRSVQPLEAYIYRQFFLRFANQAFALDDLDVYEKHFTVMNYREQERSSLHHVKAEDFVRKHWPQQYPKYAWSDVECDISDMLYSLLKCATQKSPPLGIGACKQSRALYAADIMLEWTEKEGVLGIQPKLLEVNWTPDCKRACDYYPDFFNDIFKLLFLDVLNEDVFKLIAPRIPDDV